MVITLFYVSRLVMFTKREYCHKLLLILLKGVKREGIDTVKNDRRGQMMLFLLLPK